MDKFIPILIMIIIFIVRTVNNYKKEQEKALKRNTGRPVKLPPIPESTPAAPQPTIHPASKPVEIKQEAPSSPYAAFQGVVEDPSRELLHAADKGTGKSMRSEAYRLDAGIEDHTLEDIRDGFDIEQAVVMSAILHRPYA